MCFFQICGVPLLDALKYNNTSDTPTNATRAFGVTVNDGTATSAVASKAITPDSSVDRL